MLTFPLDPVTVNCPVAIRRGEGAQMKWCRDPRCSPRGNPACRGTFGGRMKAVRALRRRRGQGPHLAKRWDPRGFSRVAAAFSSYASTSGLQVRCAHTVRGLQAMLAAQRGALCGSTQSQEAMHSLTQSPAPSREPPVQPRATSEPLPSGALLPMSFPSPSASTSLALPTPWASWVSTHPCHHHVRSLGGH